MDRFELNWPGADASFYTDGWRCRIVWRQKGRRGGGGMGGTIDNNQQCVKRAAESLDGAPYLLSALKARGHARLAEQIETAAATVPEAAPVRTPVQADRQERRKEARNRPAPKRVPKSSKAQSSEAKPEPVAAAKAAAGADVETVWLKALDGDASFEPATNKRAKAWLDLGALGDEAVSLKVPAAKQKADWVLKRTWPEDAKHKPEYVVAASFKGIARFLLERGAGAAFLEEALAALADADNDELTAAAKAWRATARTH